MEKMKKLLACAGVALLTTCTGGPPAYADAVCAPRDKLIKVLNEQFQETPRSIGLLDFHHGILEIYQSATGTWTIFVTDTNKRSCVLATGTDWETMEVPDMEGERSEERRVGKECRL